MVSVYVRQSLIQLHTPDEMRGRVGAVSQLTISASNELGEAESGLLAALLGPVGAVCFGGIGAIGDRDTLGPAVPGAEACEDLRPRPTSLRPRTGKGSDAP